MKYNGLSVCAVRERVNRYARIICEYVMGTVVGLGNACSLVAPPRGSAQKHFHTAAPLGRRCESALTYFLTEKVTKRLH